MPEPAYPDRNTTREQARFQPYLLSRLTDLEPHVRKDVGDRLITSKQLKWDIFQNLDMLFNSRSHPSLEELKGSEDLEDSVLGYGISDFCGKMHSDNNEEYLRAHILKQLQVFEPRLVKDSIEVKFRINESSIKSILEFTISGIVDVKEVNEEVQFITRLDTETGITEIEYE